MPLRPITAAAYITRRHPDLVRRWYLSGRLTSACDLKTRAILVDVAELVALSATRQTHPRLR